ncbi:MAG TPA: 3-dehydroquinate synthase, partial [Chthoniobacterales bacterium]|nr:3-dehydroquinate synthase [Chthoniobacterales bacterium]
ARKKNFIGTFAPPFAVINDKSLLRTLTPAQTRDAYSEAIKVALIRDADFFDKIERNADALQECEPTVLRQLICRCAELHVQHIATSGDPFETGSARPLDFGHWSAHKLEQLSNFRISHGAAVAAGIAVDTAYSHLMGLLDRASADRVLTLLRRLGFDLSPAEFYARADEVLDGLEEFREHLGGDLTITLLRGIGEGVEVHAVDRDLMIQAMASLASG